MPSDEKCPTCGGPCERIHKAKFCKGCDTPEHTTYHSTAQQRIEELARERKQLYHRIACSNRTPSEIHADTDPVIDAAEAMPAPDAMMDRRSIMDYWKRLRLALNNCQRAKERTQTKGESDAG